MVTEAYFHQRPCPFIRKSTQIDNLHVEHFQERHFLEIKKSNAKNHTGLGGVGHWGITHSPYS